MSRLARYRRDGRSLVATAFSPSTTYDSPFLRRSKNPNAPRASADPGSVIERMASCHADQRRRAPRTPKRGCVHAKHGILPFSLGKRSLLVLRFASCEAGFDEGGLPEHRSVAVFTRNMASCHFRLANAVCRCCASHPAKQASTRAGSPNTEASIRRLGAARVPSSPTQSPSRRASEACSGSPPGDATGAIKPH
jgi:hypothetical protein